MASLTGGRNLGTATGHVTINLTQPRAAVGQMRQIGAQMRQAFDQTATGAARVQGAFRNIASAIGPVVAGYVSMRTAMAALDLARQAAQAERTAGAFTTLSGGAAAAAANLRAIQEASNRSVSQFQAMRIANQAMALGLADSSEEMARLTRAARAVTFVSPVITDISSAITELALASANLSFRRLDQLGLSVTEVRKRMEELRVTMVGADDNAIFLQAAVDILNTKYAALLNTTGDSASKFEQAATAWADARVEFGKAIQPAAAETLTVLTNALIELRKALEALDKRPTRRPWWDIFGDQPGNQAFLGLGELSPPGTTPGRLGQSIGVREEVRALERELTRLQNLRQGILVRGGPTDSEFFRKLETQIERVNRRLEETQRKLAIISGSGRLPNVRGGGAPQRPPPLGGAGGGAAAFSEDQTAAIREWARSVQSIERAAADARLEATEQYERQRTETIRSYEQSIAREAEDFARSRARQIADHERALAGAIADARLREQNAERDFGEKVVEIRADAAKRLAELEERFQRDRVRRERDHRDRLLDAAARLDAAAVFEQQRNFARQSRDAEENFRDQQQDAREQLSEREEDERKSHQRRLLDAREANERRLGEMQESFEIARQREDEDRAIRLARQAEDFRQQLSQQDAAHALRLAQISRHAAREREELNAAFQERMIELGHQNAAYEKILDARERLAIKAAERFFDAVERRLTEARERVTGPRGIAGPIRSEFQHGGPVPRTEVALLHRGEHVLTAAQANLMRSVPGAAGVSFNGSITVNIGGGSNLGAGDLYGVARQAFLDALREMAA